ncbi:MAG: metallophosphoesterase [Deltaproteobacteria bacterium]|nr:metallophosphoesterase [Deltaproteobacteria bacterium]
MHISDLHAGWSFRAEVGDALVEAATAIRPDGIVCSGDLVQRSELRSHWRQASAFLARFEAPLIAVPGNHDLPVFNPLTRLVAPLARYRAGAHREVDRVLSLPAAVVVGLSTPKRWTIDLGFVSPAQIEWAAAQFAAHPPHRLQVVAIHHGLRQLPVGLARNHVRGSARLTQALAAMGVHAVLSGHNHFPHVELLGHAGRHFVWSQAGTSTSNRIRHPEWRQNHFSLIRAGAEQLHVEWWHFHKGTRAFERGQAHVFALAGGRVTPVAPEAADRGGRQSLA